MKLSSSASPVWWASLCCRAVVFGLVGTVAMNVASILALVRWPPSGPTINLGGYDDDLSCIWTGRTSWFGRLVILSSTIQATPELRRSPLPQWAMPHVEGGDTIIVIQLGWPFTVGNAVYDIDDRELIPSLIRITFGREWNWQCATQYRPDIVGCIAFLALSATVAATIDFTRFALVVSLRARRGFCQSCGYNLTGLTWHRHLRCPECGSRQFLRSGRIQSEQGSAPQAR